MLGKDQKRKTLNAWANVCERRGSFAAVKEASPPNKKELKIKCREIQLQTTSVKTEVENYLKEEEERGKLNGFQNKLSQ